MVSCGDMGDVVEYKDVTGSPNPCRDLSDRSLSKDIPSWDTIYPDHLFRTFDGVEQSEGYSPITFLNNSTLKQSPLGLRSLNVEGVGFDEDKNLRMRGGFAYSRSKLSCAKARL